MSYLKLLLYYPNKWKKCECILVDKPKFNWFLCGKKYMLNELVQKTSKEILILEIPEGTKFYDSQTGRSYSSTKKIKLGFDEGEGLDGFVVENDSLDDTHNDLLYEGATFHIPKDALTEDSPGGVIGYSKCNNKCIRRVYSTYPSPEGIDRLVVKYGNAKVSIVLYRKLVEYFIYNK